MQRPTVPADDDLEGIAALRDPVRRRLYRFVASQAEAVGRQEAAAVLSLPRSTVAAHLDRLVALGLLEVEYRRLGGRTGPGAGRSSKLYRRAARDLSVSLPPRDYLLAAEILARAVAGSDGLPVSNLAAKVANDEGRAIASTIGLTHANEVGEQLDKVLRALAEQGFEPELDGGEIRLGNCPFHLLASRFTELVCGLNLQLLGGMTHDCPAITPRLQPERGSCCVRLQVTSPVDQAARSTKGAT